MCVFSQRFSKRIHLVAPFCMLSAIIKHFSSSKCNSKLWKIIKWCQQHQQQFYIHHLHLVCQRISVHYHDQWLAKSHIILWLLQSKCLCCCCCFFLVSTHLTSLNSIYFHSCLFIFFLSSKVIYLLKKKTQKKWKFCFAKCCSSCNRLRLRVGMNPFSTMSEKKKTTELNEPCDDRLFLEQ